MKDTGIPLDDSIISLFLNPRTKFLKPIHMDFKVVDYSNDNELYDITGFIDVKDLYLRKFRSYPQKTSYKLYEQVAKDLGLGYNSNIDDTDDKMTWINTGDKLVRFLNDTLKYTYKSDEAFLKHYIDYYYHLNYVDLEKELKRDIEKEMMDKLKDVEKKISEIKETNQLFCQKSGKTFYLGLRVYLFVITHAGKHHAANRCIFGL
jgi:hypothetical protein